MNYSTLLLLLLVSKFTYCMVSPQLQNESQREIQPEEDIQSEILEEVQNEKQEEILSELQEESFIPFTYSYSDETKKFLKKITNDYSVTLLGKMKLELYSLIYSLKPKKKKTDDDCIMDSRPTSSSSRFQLAVNGNANCKSKCSSNNKEYIRFLNNNISLLIKKLYPGPQQPYRIKLNPIDLKTGDCVYNENYKIFECVCNTNYQIMISKSLDETIRQLNDSLVNGANVRDLTFYYKNETYFSAFTLLLKFHPITAPLFLGYLYLIFDVHLEKTPFECCDSADVNLDIEAQVVHENVDGMIDNKGAFIKKEDKLFKMIITEASHKSRDLRALAEFYLNTSQIFSYTAICLITVVFVEGIGALQYYVKTS